MRIFSLILILCLFPIITESQTTNYAIGGGIGFGNFFGNFPSQTTFNTKIYLETRSPISLFNKFQFNFTYGQKIEKFLPGSYKYKHYSYFTSFGISGVFIQQISSSLFVEEGIGLIYLNDRSFSDIDQWNIGMLLNILGGIPITNNINLYLNIDYGLTFTNTNSSYIAFMGIVKYSF